ncbi:hypothetical protein [Bdellovibrio sp. HCB274]|uniref:hypothetical protein n=1 Tax=Bdellovibrio sp. HCB274 TaxID=3394361 RepID=UPI0039B4B7AD
MKHLMTILAVSLSSHAAQAEKIYCAFTEPFINITYNSDTNKVVRSSPGSADVVGVANVIFHKEGKIAINIVGINNTVLIDTTKEGSDGMSDYIYPFEAIIDGTLYGGCETDHLKKKLSRYNPQVLR